MRSRGQHHGDLRPALIEAGLRLVAKGNVATLSLRAVAREAKVSPAAPYHHFKDRQALLAAIAVEGFEAMHETMQKVVQHQENARRVLQAMCTHYVRFACEHEAHYATMFEPSLDDGRHELLQQKAFAAFELLVAATASVLEGEELSDEVTRERATMIWALAHGMASLASKGILNPLLGMPHNDDAASVIGEHALAIALGTRV